MPNKRTEWLSCLAAALLVLSAAAGGGRAQPASTDEALGLMEDVALSEEGSDTAAVRGRKVWIPPRNYDLMLAVSDRLMNKIIAASLEKARRKKKKASASGKILEELHLTFLPGDILGVRGVYTQKATDITGKGRFNFEIWAQLDVENKHDVIFNILEASIRLNGVRIFKTTREDPSPIGVLLDFLSPKLEKSAAKKLKKVSGKLAKKLGRDSVSDDIDVKDIINIKGNVVTIKILPYLLSPLFPRVSIEGTRVGRRMLELYLSFQEAPGRRRR